MLQNTKSIQGQKLAAHDGEIGSISDFYFDETNWAIRYLVANTGSWLTGRLVLISPHSLGRPNVEATALTVNLSRKQIENCPPIDTDKPVSRQYEIDYYHYYGWPGYWYGGGLWGATNYPAMLPFSPAEREAAQHSHDNDNPHLRSIKAVTGYALQATDGEIGSISGFLMDDKTWVIGGLVAETGHWYSGKQIIIPTARIGRISYEDSTVQVNLTLADLKATGENEVAAVGGSYPAATLSRS
ncbi:MAG: PRC-barrel domain containing protein [Opitutaceae bacterium]|nr:PRC-barrel domain containing protein [Opitutaceae bacterium]